MCWRRVRFLIVSTRRNHAPDHHKEKSDRKHSNCRKFREEVKAECQACEQCFSQRGSLQVLKKRNRADKEAGGGDEVGRNQPAMCQKCWRETIEEQREQSDCRAERASRPPEQQPAQRDREENNRNSGSPRNCIRIIPGEVQELLPEDIRIVLLYSAREVVGW